MKLNFFAWKPLDISQCVTISTSKTPLVFLHGMGGTGQIWRPIAAQLEEEFQCIAFDQRGHGGSRPVPENEAHQFHALDYARDIVGMLDSLGIEKCYLIGHSMGVRTCLGVAKLIPQRIKGLIAVDVGITSTWGGGIGEPLAQFMQKLPETFPNKIVMREYLFAHCPDTSIAQYLSAVAKKRVAGENGAPAIFPSGSTEEWSFPFDHESMVETIHQADEAPLPQWLIDILDAGVKVLYLRGETSQVWLKKDYEEQRAHFLGLPNAWNSRGLLQFEEWEKCGHGLPFEQRLRFIERVKSFVQE